MAKSPTIKGKCRGEAALKKMYAEAAGISPRTAQLHARNADPRWLAWLATQNPEDPVKTAPEANLDPPKKNPAAASAAEAGNSADEGEIDVTGLTEAQADEKRARELWRRTMKSSETATAAAEKFQYGKMAAEVHKLYLAAKKARVQDDLERRTLVPVSEFETYRQSVQRVATLMQRLESELALLVNPKDVPQARRGIAEWIANRWNPGIRELIEKAELILAP